MTENRFWRLDRHPEGSDFEAALSLQPKPCCRLLKAKCG